MIPLIVSEVIEMELERVLNYLQPLQFSIRPDELLLTLVLLMNDFLHVFLQLQLIASTNLQILLDYSGLGVQPLLHQKRRLDPTHVLTLLFVPI